MTQATPKAERPALPMPSLVPTGRGLFASFQRSGEDRLVYTFVGVSTVVHLLVIFFGSFAWLRNKPPIDLNEAGTEVVLAPDDQVPARSALPEAAIAPEAKAPEQLLPQITKRVSVKEPAKPEESIAEEKLKEVPQKEAKPEEQPKKAEDLHLKTETKDDNQLEQKELLKRAALERLRLMEKTAKTAEAPEKDPLARLAEVYEKAKKSGLGSAAAKGRINQYGGLLKRAVHQNYTAPEVYNLKASNLAVLLEITLGERGELLDLGIKQPSGDPAFDQLAVQAVKASVPLPKPPPELVGQAIPLRFTP